MTPIEQAIEALETAHELAVEAAAQIHDAYRGRYPQRHAAADADVKQIADALSALRGVDQQPVAAIKWTLDGDKTCGYNNWVGETPFGRILITWKGWKEDLAASIDEFPGEMPNLYGSPDDLKADAEAEFNRRLALATPPPAPVLLTEAEMVVMRRLTDQGKHAPRASDLAFARAIEAEVLRRVGGGA